MAVPWQKYRTLTVDQWAMEWNRQTRQCNYQQLTAKQGCQGIGRRERIENSRRQLDMHHEKPMPKQGLESKEGSPNVRIPESRLIGVVFMGSALFHHSKFTCLSLILMLDWQCWNANLYPHSSTLLHSWWELQALSGNNSLSAETKNPKLSLSSRRGDCCIFAVILLAVQCCCI